MGRPSLAPAKRLRARWWQILSTVRSERRRRERLNEELLFRGLVGLKMDDPVGDARVDSKQRERWLKGEVSPAFFPPGRAQAEPPNRLVDEPWTVAGTLIEAGAGQPSFKPQGSGNPPPQGGATRK